MLGILSPMPCRAMPVDARYTLTTRISTTDREAL
jgi:hypothetical protein